MVQLSNLSKATILILVTITASVTITVEAAKAGFIDFLGIGPNTVPLINGTIINNDNKTYGILIVPTGNVTTIPVNDTEPTPPQNEPPFIEVSTPINSTVGKLVELFAEVSDEDGNVTSIIWNQENGEIANFTANGSRLSFTPTEPDTYVFSIEATDNDNATSLDTITVIVTKPGAPVPVPVPVPTPTPQPQPTPVQTTFKYIALGDIHDTSSGKLVFEQVKARNPNLISGLGDLNTYDGKDGSWFISSYGGLGNKVFCQIGNHDDGKSKIENYCGVKSEYTKKLGKFLIFGINTDGDLVKQANEITALLKNTQFMSGITDVLFNSHKFYATPPNNNHGVESDVKQMYDKINAAVPATVQDEYYIAGHNHFMAHAVINGDDHFISGAGGRDHYQCEENTVWKFCNDSSFGFLEMILKSDGTVTAQFLDYNGRVLQ